MAIVLKQLLHIGRKQQKEMKIKIKKLSENAVLPVKAHASDAGFDLTSTSCTIDEYGSMVYGTGISVEIPEGYVGLVFPRSSIAKKDLVLSNCVGVIDSGYRGEVMAKFKPTNYFNYYEDCGRIVERPHDGSIYGIGERIAQLILMPIPEIEFEEAEELSYSERGIGGYGSSGL